MGVLALPNTRTTSRDMEHHYSRPPMTGKDNIWLPSHTALPSKMAATVPDTAAAESTMTQASLSHTSMSPLTAEHQALALSMVALLKPDLIGTITATLEQHLGPIKSTLEAHSHRLSQAEARIAALEDALCVKGYNAYV